MAREDRAVYGRNGERFCPQCGVRVAQQADACFLCGASLWSPPRRWRIPLAEIILLLMVALLTWGWWRVDGMRRVNPAQGPSTERPVAAIRAPVSASATPTPTPTPTFTPTSTPTPTPTPQTYVVVRGDTLIGIAAEHGVTLERLAAFNGLDVGALLQVGQELLIPPPEGLPFPTATPTPEGVILNYVVERGDTVYLIAERFRVPQEVVLATNDIEDPTLLQPGMVLVIPLGTPKPTPTPTPILTPTPTPGPPYPPPVPVTPADGATFVGPKARIVLGWTAVDYLRPGEGYRVRLEMDNGTSWTFDTVHTSLALPASLHRFVLNGGGRVRWSVQVVDTRTHPPSPRSDPSATRTFTWR